MLHSTVSWSMKIAGSRCHWSLQKPCRTLRPLGLRTHLSSSSPTGAKLVPLTRTIELARIGPKEGTARLTLVRELSLNSTCSGRGGG